MLVIVEGLMWFSLVDVIQGIFIAFPLVFFMELGDKTQLAAFALSLKYRSPIRVLIGCFIGLSGVTIIAVFLGVVLGQTIDLEILQPIIGFIFVIGGALLLITKLQNQNKLETHICPISLESCTKPRENCPEINSCDLYLKEVVQRGALRGSMVFMFLAELGDKTMLSGIALTTQFDPIGVFIGALSALTFVNAFGIFFGEKLSQKLPTEKIEIISYFLFILVGLILLFV